MWYLARASSSVDRHSRLWRYVGLTGGVSAWFLARTAGRTWASCCSGRTVRNSESLRGLRCTLQECRGRGKARALLGPLAVRTYQTGTKALPCQSRVNERTRAKALSGKSRADERIRAKALSGPKPCGRERRLCRVKAVRTRTKALPCQSRANERTGAKALSGQSRAGELTGTKA